MAYEWNYISEIDGKVRTCFRCEVCGDGYSSIGDAEECEREHREVVDDETSQTGTVRLRIPLTRE